MTRRGFAATVLGLALAAAIPAQASAAAIPVRVRVIKGSRQGPAAIDPRLADLTAQLGALAYQKWDQVGQHDLQMEFKKPLSVPLPDGASLELTVLETQRDTVTFEVKVAKHGTHSRLTIPKDKRIVHQVEPEKNGEAYFATIRPWP